MYSIFAHFSRVDSLELYRMVEHLKLNVTEMLDRTVLHGKLRYEDIQYVTEVCYKFGVTEFTIKKEPD